MSAPAAEDLSTRVVCPSWCIEPEPHGVHQSAAVTLPRGVAKWCISLGQVDGTDPHVTLIYLGVQPAADAHWHLSFAEAARYALLCARLGEAQLAATITSMKDRAGDLVTM